MPRRPIIALIIALLTMIAFSRVITCDFVNYDDPDYVTSNSYVQKGLTIDSIKWAFFNLHGIRTYWHPVTWLSHMLDVQLFGLNPRAHHLVSLLFHTLNAVLLFLLLDCLTKQPWPSALAALLFAVHPLQVDSVAWVTERKNLLCLLFWLLTIFAYRHYVARPTVKAYLMTLLLFITGLMCKPVIVTLPFVLLLLDYWPLRRFNHGLDREAANRTVQRAVLEKIPFLILAVASALITIRAHQQLEIPRDVEKLTLDLRVQNAFVAYLRYFGKFLWPVDLAVLYPHPYRWPTLLVAASVLVLCVSTAWIVWRARREGYLFTGWFWFLGVLVPAIGIVQVGVQSMADRFAYIPLIGLVMALAWKADALRAAGPSFRKIVWGICGGSILFFTALTVRQIGFWKDSETLWTHALEVEPISPIAHVDLAAVLVDRGRPAEALEHYRQAVRFDPFWPDPWALMASTYASQKQYRDAVAAYRRALELKPNWSDLMNNLAWILATCPEDSVRDGPEAVRLALKATLTTTNDLPVMTGTLAAAYAEAGKFDLAIQTAQRARDLALAAGNRAVAARNEELAALYKTGKPYRDQ